MSTLDKINEELSVLETELSQLHHYTNEIGNAKDAAKSVINMSLNFLKDFQEKVVAINKQMDVAAKDFKKNVDKTSSSLEAASNDFQQGISEAKSELDVIGNQLAKAAKNVNDLTAKIEDINILGHFTKIHESFSDAKNTIVEIQAKLERKLGDIEERQEQHYKVLKKVQVTSAIIIGLLLLIVIIVAFLK